MDKAEISVFFSFSFFKRSVWGKGGLGSHIVKSFSSMLLLHGWWFRRVLSKRNHGIKIFVVHVVFCIFNEACLLYHHIVHVLFNIPKSIVVHVDHILIIDGLTCLLTCSVFSQLLKLSRVLTSWIKLKFSFLRVLTSWIKLKFQFSSSFLFLFLGQGLGSHIVK